MRLIKTLINKWSLLNKETTHTSLYSVTAKDKLDNLKKELDNAHESELVTAIRKVVTQKLLTAVLETEKSSTEEIIKNQGRIEAYKFILQLLPNKEINND